MRYVITATLLVCIIAGIIFFAAKYNTEANYNHCQYHKSLPLLEVMKDAKKRGCEKISWGQIKLAPEVRKFYYPTPTPKPVYRGRYVNYSNNSVPTSTSTPLPTATSTPVPTPTKTKVIVPTKVPTKVITPTKIIPTITPTKAVKIPTIVPTPTETPTKAPTPTKVIVVKPTPTLMPTATAVPYNPPAPTPTRIIWTHPIVVGGPTMCVEYDSNGNIIRTWPVIVLPNGQYGGCGE